MSLRYGGTVEPRPKARLSGWFERHLRLWRVFRWLELDGSTLTYRHRPNGDPEWTCDLREARVSAGSNACELVLHRAGCEPLSLFAPTLDELKLWFAQIKSVSDSVYDFYHLSAKMGRTRHGVIYLGCDKKNHEDVSIHAIEKTNLPLQKMLILTKRDLSVMEATQSHNSVVRVIDLFESTLHFYIVTELISGGLLADSLSCPLTEDIARSIMAHILQGLQHLHTNDVVHGNINPSTIMCTRHSLPCPVKIAAYGHAATRRDARLLGGANLKDCHSLAPEVVCFQRRTVKSDIFSAGVLLFWMLSGTYPFSAEHESGYLASVSQGLFFKESVWDEVSDEAKSLIRRMLDDDASVRPSATDCLDCEWFRRGLVDTDAAEIEDDFVRRSSSDPKTVIMDFEYATSMKRGPISGSPETGMNGLSYEKLD